MPTRSSSSAARASAARFDSPKCVWSASRICRPIVSTGFSAVIGSWKIIAISRPRTTRSSRSLIWSRSRPSNCAVPPATRPGTGQEPEQREAVTLLPQPDSPTIPSVSPGAMSNEIPLTASIVPRRVQNSTRRSRDREQRRQARPRSFGSSSSRRPSPIRLKPSTEITIARTGVIASTALQRGTRSRRSASSPTPASTDPAVRARGSRGPRRR